MAEKTLDTLFHDSLGKTVDTRTETGHDMVRHTGVDVEDERVGPRK